MLSKEAATHEKALNQQRFQSDKQSTTTFVSSTVVACWTSGNHSSLGKDIALANKYDYTEYVWVDASLASRLGTFRQNHRRLSEGGDYKFRVLSSHRIHLA